jgi:alpha-tubulin suppressor-like RCC1 family protein
VRKPRLIEALGGVVCSLCAAGDAHSLVGSADGASVFEFGGDGGSSSSTPALVDHLSDASSIVALAAGGKHSVALDVEGRVFCWGDGKWGQKSGGEGGGVVAHSVVAGWRHTAVVLKE